MQEHSGEHQRDYSEITQRICWSEPTSLDVLFLFSKGGDDTRPDNWQPYKQIRAESMNVVYQTNLVRVANANEGAKL